MLYLRNLSYVVVVRVLKHHRIANAPQRLPMLYTSLRIVPIGSSIQIVMYECCYREVAPSSLARSKMIKRSESSRWLILYSLPSKAYWAARGQPRMTAKPGKKLRRQLVDADR